ncbi:MAG: SDR family NAD(P)-dependent oxidoreductase [Rhodospirillales bacterium]|jgi:NAD(P)-dependent dehydrogenase (short-subunit alcohol dehydrogenase family)
MIPTYRTALIVGAGPGLGAALARRFAKEGLQVGVCARDVARLSALATETRGVAFAADVGDPFAVSDLFDAVDAELGPPDVVVFNPSARLRGPFVELAGEDVRCAVVTTALGGFHVAQEAARRMVPKGHGAILFTGASASVKGYARSAPFAMGKFALRGLAQSLARELHPQGIHVGHFVIDGAIRAASRPEPGDRPDSHLDPAAIAEAYWQFLSQDRSAWSWEVELRPWVETF